MITGSDLQILRVGIFHCYFIYKTILIQRLHELRTNCPQLQHRAEKDIYIERWNRKCYLNTSADWIVWSCWITHWQPAKVPDLPAPATQWIKTRVGVSLIICIKPEVNWKYFTCCDLHWSISEESLRTEFLELGTGWLTGQFVSWSCLTILDGSDGLK